MKKILITTSSFNLDHFKEVETRLISSGLEVMANPYSRRLSSDEVKVLLTGDIVGMIAGVEPLTLGVLESAKYLKVIARCGTGLDSVDLNAAAKFGIRVSNTPDSPTIAVAELTIAHILNLMRQVSLANYAIRQGAWKPLMGRLLSGKTVGVIGYGRIGKKVAKLLSAFGAKVLAYDPVCLHQDGVATFVSLEELLQTSDIVSLHLPYSEASHHIMGKDEIWQMKPGSMLFNISRGGLVDESALYLALKKKHLSGAGLDAFESEPYLGPLCELDNVLLTSHMGSYAKEARVMQEKEAVSNLLADLEAVNILNR